MRPPDEVQRDSVRRWIEKAGEDLDTAIFLRSQGWPLGAIIAFHSQQAVEKYLKAFLVRHQLYFPKTHDIRQLLDLVKIVEPTMADVLRESEMLTPYSVETRYPDGAPALLPGAEIGLVDIACKTRDAVLQVLHPYLSERKPAR